MERSVLNGFAIDIGGTKTAAARIAGGEIVSREVRPTGGEGLADHLDRIDELLRTLGWRLGAGKLGVTVTGRVTSDGQWSAVNAKTLRGIDAAPLGASLLERFGSAKVSNDAAATAYAEQLFGSGRGNLNFVYITVSTGVGGGIVLGGRMLESRCGLAGHLGFTSCSFGEGLREFRDIRTVEGIAAGRAIAAAAATAGHPDTDARQVFAAAARGEAWASVIVETSARAIAELCANVTSIFDPECIAVGGSIGLAPGYLEKVRAHLEREPAILRRPVVAASLGPDGPLLGALAHGLKV